MEKLANHTLVYDSDCPMCNLYTKGFIKAGMLDENGRVAYGCAKVPVTFDNQRARNEIALIDYSQGTVTYGLDSLLKVIGHSFPLIGKIFRSSIIRSPLNLLYSFISYNRKVIAPPHVFEKRGACTPVYRVEYRIAYIVFAWLMASLVLARYFSSTLVVALLACGLHTIFQLVFVRIISRDKILHYVGNMMTVSLIGALLLLPMILVSPVVDIAPLISLAWFIMVVTFMLIIHWRRVKWLGLPVGVHVTWIASIFFSWIMINPV